MGCPLYKSMKARGTTFYSFPSASSDMNLAFTNDNYKINFSKFALLNIPKQDVKISNGMDRDQTKGKLNFDKDQDGPMFYNFQPDGNSELPTIYSEQLIESLRNYVSNYDTTLRESRINSNTDFYNINEKVTPTEMIFWKWCKKLNILDFEPALHKIDWDKNLPGFENSNGINTDYFRKYLWKERDVNLYTCEIEESNINANKAMLIIANNTKFKSGDNVLLSGDTGIDLENNVDYEVLEVVHDIVGDTPYTYLHLDILYTDELENPVCEVYLNYNKLIQYIGEIESVSKIQTSKKNYTEVTAHIPHHAGKTPTILFDIENNTNYYPNMEMPILPIEQQEEIVGSENTISPIRLNPENYPGTYYGYFDTQDKTYKCYNGDKLRYSGGYYGINLVNNTGLDFENYFEKLNDFDSSNLDGLKINMNREHYLKMNLPDQEIKNFDEFNSAYLDGVPEDFEFNAILWYYDIDDGSGDIVTNLYGIEFLNNPNDDGDNCDIENKKITPYIKYVSNGEQDGVSYTFNLNLNFNIDNDVLPLSYDPTTIHNNFSFDLYKNLLNSNANLQENYIEIINNFKNLYDDITDLKGLIYTQTKIDTINKKIENFENLLNVYSTMQMVDGVGTTIETNLDGIYPKMSVNVNNPMYAEILNINTSDILYYNNLYSGVSYNINVPQTNDLLLNIHNDNHIYDDAIDITLKTDLKYQQSLDIYIKPNMSDMLNDINLKINYNNGRGTVEETTLISNIKAPVDIITYDEVDLTASTFTNSYYTNTNIQCYGHTITTDTNALHIKILEDLFNDGDYIYIENLYMTNNDNVTNDYSGVYKISNYVGSDNDYGSGATITIELPSVDLVLKTKPTISYYKGYKINILRISPTSTSNIVDRYKITKELL